MAAEIDLIQDKNPSVHYRIHSLEFLGKAMSWKGENPPKFTVYQPVLTEQMTFIKNVGFG